MRPFAAEVARFSRLGLANVNVVIRSLLYRNALSALLFVVAIVGIGVQLRLIHQGIVEPQTRLVLIAYILIAIYAVASIALRLRSAKK